MSALENAGLVGQVLLLMTMSGGVLALVMVALAVPKRTVRGAVIAAAAVIGVGCSLMLLGSAGEQASLVRAYENVAHAPPTDRLSLMELSEAEAKSIATFGAFGGGPLAVLGAGVLVITFLRFPRRTS